MPTEEFVTADSESGSSRFRIRACNTTTVIEDSARSIEAGGWQFLPDNLQPKAHGRLTFPYGTPYTWEPDPPIADGDKQVMGPEYQCTLQFLAVQHISFCFYDPFRQIPPAPTTGQRWVEMGLTAEESFLNVYAAMLAEPVIVAFWDIQIGVIEVQGLGLRPTFEFEAIDFGPQGNHEEYGGSGHIRPDWQSYWSSGGVLGDGGYILKTGDSLLDGSGPYMQVKITQSREGEPCGPRFDFTWSRTGYPDIRPTFYLATLEQQYPPQRLFYTIIASDWQFFIFLEGYDGSQAFSSIFCVIPAAFEDASPGCLLGCSDSGYPWRTRLKWLGNVYCAREGNDNWGDTLQGPIGNALPRPCTFPLKFPERSLLTSSSRPLMGNAWLAVPPHFGNYGRDAVPLNSFYQPRIIGKFWDALVLSRSATLDSRFFWQGNAWQCIASQTGAVGSTDGSLWIRLKPGILTDPTCF